MSDNKGMVYFAQMPDGLIKIGHSIVLDQRMKALKGPKVLATVECENGPAAESVFHGWFWPMRDHHEYFRITVEEVQDAIKRYDEQDGYLTNRAGFHECVRCNYRWIGKIAKPKSCPKCKRYDWGK